MHRELRKKNNNNKLLSKNVDGAGLELKYQLQNKVKGSKLEEQNNDPIA